MRARDLAPPQGDELIVIVGPTASGKTDLALELAERWNGEILSADSVQIYRGFDIGSGKPSAEERARAPHHLVDALGPLDPIDAAAFASMAERALGDIRSRGRVPIVCGGTFLWVKALVYGLADAPPADDALRLRHRALVDLEGRAALHLRLAQVDAVSAARLAPNDFIRVSRALEVFELTGKPLADWQAAHGFARPRHTARLYGVERQRDAIDKRIAERVDRWLAEGWIAEVAGLIEGGFAEARALGAIGYKQVREHLEGRLSKAELAAAIVRATRVFVRRQRTWLRDEPVTYLERSR